MPWKSTGSDRDAGGANGRGQLHLLQCAWCMADGQADGRLLTRGRTTGVRQVHVQHHLPTSRWTCAESSRLSGLVTCSRPDRPCCARLDARRQDQPRGRSWKASGENGSRESPLGPPCTETSRSNGQAGVEDTTRDGCGSIQSIDDRRSPNVHVCDRPQVFLSAVVQGHVGSATGTIRGDGCFGNAPM